MSAKLPLLLSIAGSDSSAGAGVQADIKTCESLGVYATTAITTITAQNLTGVIDVKPLSSKLVRAQCEAVLSDFEVDIIKIGLLGSHQIIKEVAHIIAELGENKPPIILDPVIGASTGAFFLGDKEIETLKSDLFPHCFVVTPNIAEAERLLSRSIKTQEDMEDAVQEIASMTLEHQGIMTGGEGLSAGAHDCLFAGGEKIWIESKHVESTNTHGTGCTYATALACYLAIGHDIKEAAQNAKRYVMNCLVSHKNVRIGKEGKGPGPVMRGS